MKITAVFDIDINELKEVSGIDNILEAIQGEMVWVAEAGVYLLSMAGSNTNVSITYRKGRLFLWVV